MTTELRGLKYLLSSSHYKEDEKSKEKINSNHILNCKKDFQKKKLI